MLKRLNKGMRDVDTRSAWCVFCDKNDVCTYCDATDWACDGGYEICITKDLS